MKPGGAPGGVFKTADGWMSILALNDRDWREPVHGDGDAGAGRTIRASPPLPLRLAQRRGALCPHAAGDRARAPSAVWGGRLTAGAPDA